MKKKIRTYSNFLNLINNWKKKFEKDQNLKLLSKKLFDKADKYHFHYFQSWNGEPMIQTPDDILTLQELIYKNKPEVILEIGVAWGGTILLYNTLSKELPIKKIIGVDIFIPNDLKKRIQEKTNNSNKIILLEGSSLDNKLIKQIKKITKKYKNFLIHLDSNHTEAHVLEELNIYSKFLNKNNYLIVGDTILYQIPNQKHRPRSWSKINNPMTALLKFLKKNKSFRVDKSINNGKIFTNQPNGYIIKK